jgi:hypothetical protein
LGDRDLGQPLSVTAISPFAIIALGCRNDLKIRKISNSNSRGKPQYDAKGERTMLQLSRKRNGVRADAGVAVDK